MRYRRSLVQGGTYFFTVNLMNRKSDLLLRRIDLLRLVIQQVKKEHPFTILAMVVLPDHLHAIWQLPVSDVDFPLRWSLIKSSFSRRIPKSEYINPSRRAKRERGIWQRRYWEHQIRDENDLEQHVNYIHFNPVKHGLVIDAVDWPHSSLHRYIERGWLSPDWGKDIDSIGGYGER